MRKLMALLLALGIVLALCVPALAEAAEKAEPSPIFEKLFEQKWYTWAVVAALALAAAILAAASKRGNWNSRRIAMAAMCIAIAFVLSCIQLYRMPQGGLITPAGMLPLVMFMLACGPLPGFVAGCAFGLLELIADPWVIHPVQLLVDYPLAYGAMILGCLAALIPVKREFKLPLAVLLGSIGRYAMAVLSGTVFSPSTPGIRTRWSIRCSTTSVTWGRTPWSA